MNALAFDPWAALKRQREDATPAKVANPANPIPHSPPGLADLAGLAGVPSPTHEIAIDHEAASSLARAAILPADGPFSSCSNCGASLYWRLSVLSGGPGPWTCRRCHPPVPGMWLDACAFPRTAGVQEALI
jgi:hypothetical protein